MLIATSTALQSSANPAGTGQAIQLSASVSPAGSTGSVAFLDGGTLLGTVTVSGGSAQWSVPLTTVGTHVLTATYSGDATHAPGVSANLSQTVSQSILQGDSPGAGPDLSVVASAIPGFPAVAPPSGNLPVFAPQSSISITAANIYSNPAIPSAVVRTTGWGDLENISGVPGQGETTPVEKVFDYHFIVRIPSAIAAAGQATTDQYYDPSCGVTYASPAIFESHAVAGYADQILGDTPGGTSYHFRTSVTTVSGVPSPDITFSCNPSFSIGPCQ